MAAAKKEFKMMPGTNTGATYLLIGKKGNVALGIKPTAVMKGEAFNAPGNTWFGARLRSAPGGELLKNMGRKVVKLEAQPENLWDAWPSVVWEKKGSDRASTTIGILLPGEPSGSEEEIEKFLSQIRGGKLAAQIAAYLVELIGLDHLILSEAEIAAWFNGHYQKIVEAIAASIKRNRVVAEAMTEAIGTFGMHAAILKEVYDATGETLEPVLDEDGEPAGDDHDNAS